MSVYYGKLSLSSPWGGAYLVYKQFNKKIKLFGPLRLLVLYSLRKKQNILISGNRIITQ